MRKTILLFWIVSSMAFAEPADSSAAVLATDSAAIAPSIEQTILAEPPSRGELVRKARDYLLKALLSGDSAKALQTIAFLNDQYSPLVCPFAGVEKGLAYLQTQKYDSALTTLMRDRRLLPPQAKRAVTEEDRCVVDYRESNLHSSRFIRDELSAYLEKDNTWTASQVDSLISRIQASGVEPFYKDAAPAFLPVILTPSWGRTEASRVQSFSNAASAFSEKYPANEDGLWLMRHFVEPLSARVRDVPNRGDDPIAAHLYGGGSGIGFEVLTGRGFLSGDLKDEFHHTFWDYSFSVPIQLHRFVFTPFVSYGYIETKKTNRFSDAIWLEGSELAVYEGGITLGFVAFDSRFVKLEPFVGIASAEAALPDNSDDYNYYYPREENYYYNLRDHVEHNNSVAYLAGLTGELRLLTLYSPYGTTLTSVSFRVRYLASFIDHDFGYKKIDGVSQKVMAGLGFFIW